VALSLDESKTNKMYSFLLQKQPKCAFFTSLVVLGVLLTGCGTGEYNRRLEQTVSNINNQVLWDAATTLQDAAGMATGVSLQLPLFVVNAPVRDQPQGLTLPGFAYSYPVEGGSIHVAAVSAETGIEQVKSEAGQSIPGANWTDAPMGGLPGARVSGTVAEKRLDLYVVTSGTHHVLIGWHGDQGNAAFFQAADQSMASLVPTE
jgi:hypothetical protein